MKEEEQTQLIDKILERMATLIAVLVGMSLILQAVRPVSPLIAPWVVWFLVFYVVTITFGGKTVQKMKWARRALLCGVVAAAILLIGVQVYQHNQEVRVDQAKAALEKKLAGGLWIAYESSSIDPYKGKYPSSEDIRRELQILASDGFNSLITFSASGSLADIPRIAKELGFKAVIMGIIHVTDDAELGSAISARDYVDAYCVGHMFMDYPYSELDVLQALHTVRSATGKPVTTTLRPNGYLAFPNVSSAIDFFFPDIHTNWYSDGTAANAVTATKAFVDETRKLQERYPNKPVLLKLISIPSEEVPGASTEQQYQFYRRVVEYVESSMTFPERVYPSYFSAFDLPWKTPERKWPPGERYVGFYDALGKAKLASIGGVQVRVVDALQWSRVSTAPSRN